MDQNNQPAQKQRTFNLQRTYLKKFKFETPGSPQIFTVEWKPESKMNLQSEVKKLNEDVYEVTLSIVITNQVGELSAFNTRIEQAGIFTIRGFSEDEMQQMVGTYCPSTLFPFARDVIANYATRCGFPQHVLAPVNFDEIFARKLKETSSQQ